jgi:C-terminal processing protease CtpA/Prc
MRKIVQVCSLLVVVALLLTACGRGTPAATETAAAEEPYLVTGSMDFTNAFINYIFEEHAVALVDMYAFVIRDEEWEIPVASQTLGYMDMDEDNMHAEYTLQLPARPTGQFVDVDNDDEADTGVQIFAVSYWPNVYGGPYSEGDDRSRGWPSGFSSVRTDPERDDEVNGGILIVWAPDGDQSFPTGYGADAMLFTEDDPVAPLPAGWTVVDLDQTPFAFIKEAEPVVPLYEPSDYAVKDYSTMSYTEAFDALVDFLRLNYAFNGIPGKEPDYDALVAQIRPRVVQAEQDNDPQAYYLALRDFTRGFSDGHVGLDGGDIQTQLFLDDTAGGYGFAIRELDDGRFVVVYVRNPGPAQSAGMQVGAEITAFNDTPIGEAVSQVTPWALPQSTEWQIRYQQARYLLRTQPGTQATVTFVNPGGQPQTVTLTAIAERDSFSRTSIYYGAPENLLPVEFRVLDSGVGYVAVYSEADDIQLTIKLFERALQAFQALEVPGIIIDMRYNGGGTPLGLAGFLTDQEIPLGQSSYFNENTGQFEPEGTPDRILPNQNQYRFDKIVVLVGPACASACEEEAYGFSQVPGAQVVGMFATSSMFGEVSRGQFIMPEGFTMQFPTGRYLLPDGTLFLEGTGVQPTLRVPITEQTVITEEDVVLQFGENAILLPLGAGLEPSGPPRLVTNQAQAQAGLLGRADWLQDRAREEYNEEIFEPHTLTYTVPLTRSEDLIWTYVWCARADVLEQNFAAMRFEFVLDGQVVPQDQLFVYNYDTGDGNLCRFIYALLTDWPAGEHHLTITATFTRPINDGIGATDYAAGDYIYEYAVYVKP